MLGINMRLILRNSTRPGQTILSCISSVQKFSDKKDTPEPPAKDISKDDVKDNARKKLSLLLQQMVEEDVVKPKAKLNLAKPKGRLNKADTRVEKGTKSVTSEPVEKKIIAAVKDVASTIGGDSKQTESELLSKLLNTSKPDSAESTASLSDIFKGMKIDRSEKPSPSRAEQVKYMLRDNDNRERYQTRGKPYPYKKRQMPDRKHNINAPVERIDLFGSEPLGIFTKDSSIPTEITVRPQTTWDKLHQRELKLAVTHPPENYFQQLIQWTEQGKLWKFPIDNEQGMEEEQSVYFADHIFLEKHLETWCPSRGPIRHFMELVCVGMSKNPYMSVKTKREHIEWYREYFNEKKQLLQEVGAIPVGEGQQKPEKIA